MNTPPPAIPTEKFFVVVALFESPTTLIAPPSFAGLLMITKDATKALVTARGAEDGMKFKAGGYVAIYHTTLDRSLIEYDLHRIGDDSHSQRSPIVFTRTKTGEGWTEQWFEKKFYMENGQLRHVGATQQSLEFIVIDGDGDAKISHS